jgi:hypothetical protein
MLELESIANNAECETCWNIVVPSKARGLQKARSKKKNRRNSESGEERRLKFYQRDF